MNDDEIKNKKDPVSETPPDDVELVADEEYGEEGGTDIVKKLRAKLKELQAKCQEYMTGWQRAKADYVNARRMEEESRMEFLKYGERKMLLELLALADSFDMALASVPENGSPEKSAGDWLAGIKNIRGQLEKIFASHGVRQMTDIVGKKFDPARHEALASEIVADEAQDDTVLAEMMKGYEIHDKVLRPAKVKVGEFKSRE